jgi:hypothetical protein
MVQSLVDRGRATAMQIAENVQNEVAKQLGWLANRVDDVEDQMEAFVTRFNAGDGTVPGVAEAVDSAARAVAPTTKKAPGRKAAGKKAAPKKAAAPEKASAKKAAAAKRAPAKKTAARKAAAKKAPAKKAAAAKRAPARKAVASAERTTKRVAKKAASATKQAVGSSGVAKVATSRPG